MPDELARLRDRERYADWQIAHLEEMLRISRGHTADEERLRILFAKRATEAEDECDRLRELLARWLRNHDGEPYDAADVLRLAEETRGAVG
jgi:hypothetical protein